jgi:Domain of unknown function in PX-proteins (DUF3818)
VIYHLFVAEDNSTELFSQAQRIHSLMPYSILKNILRFSNPMAMLRGIWDLFLAQPFGQRSLLQRILSVTLNDDIRKLQKDIDILREKIEDDGLCEKIKGYVYADPVIQDGIRKEVVEGKVELITAIMRSEDVKPPLEGKQIIRMHTAFTAWNSAIDAVLVFPSKLIYRKNLFNRIKRLRYMRDLVNFSNYMFDNEINNKLCLFYLKELLRVYCET